MEAVGAGANVLTFVLLGLKSAQVVHDIFSTIRDAPQTVQTLVGHVAQLQGILQSLKTLEYRLASQEAYTALESAVQNCSRDLEDLASKSQQLEVLPTENRAGKLWKRIKATVGEKGLQRMGDSVVRHVVILNTHLQLWQVKSTSASQTQYSEIIKLLGGIQSQVSTICANIEPRPFFLDPPSCPATSIPLTFGDDIDNSPSDESVLRLIDLVANKEGIVASDDAQQIIDNLEELLRSIEKGESRVRADVASSRQDHSSEDVSRELKIVCGLLTSAPSLSVNTAGISIVRVAPPP